MYLGFSFEALPAFHLECQKGWERRKSYFSYPRCLLARLEVEVIFPTCVMGCLLARLAVEVSDRISRGVSGLVRRYILGRERPRDWNIRLSYHSGIRSLVICL